MTESNRKNPEYLETRSIGRLLFEFSLPAIVASVVTSTYSLVARIFVGQRFGVDEGVAAVTTAFPVIILFLAVAMMIGAGTTILISIRLGERKIDKAEEALGQALLLSFLTSVVFVVFGQIYIEPLLRLFGASDAILPTAKSYLSVIIWGVLPQHVAFGVNNFIRAEGKPRVAMVSMILSAVVNCALDWYFLFYLKTGIWGAGVANVIASCVAAGWICWLYFSGRTVLKWRAKYIFRFNWKLTRRIMAFGTVPFAAQACSAIVQATQNNLLGFYGSKYGEAMNYPFDGGDVAIGVMGTATAIGAMLLMPFLGFGQGLQPIVGYNVGAKRPDRVRATLTLALKIVLAVSFVWWAVAMARPGWFVRPFLKPDELGFAEKYELGVFAIRAIMSAIPLIAVNILASGYFQAQGRSLLATTMTISRQLGFLLIFLYFLPRVFERFGRPGLDGCWFSFPLADACACVISVVYLVLEYRAKAREIAEYERLKLLKATTEASVESQSGD